MVRYIVRLPNSMYNVQWEASGKCEGNFFPLERMITLKIK